MSDISLSPEPSDSPLPESSSSTAPWKTFSRAGFTSVEYPGPVSQPSALLKVTTQEDINECFNAPSSQQVSLEMSYRRENRNGVPVRGARVPCQKLLVKIVRRRRKASTKGKEKDEDSREGIFTAEIEGPISHTVRFRAMADWHYTPNPEGRIALVVNALHDLDYDAILDYFVPDETYVAPVTPPEDASDGLEPEFRSLLDLQPPPIFSERKLPLVYNYKNPPQAVVQEVQHIRTGEIKQRYVNKARFVAHPVQTIGHGHPSGVPQAPIKAVSDRMDKLDEELLERLRQLFEERPVWLRHALLSQFTSEERHIIVTNKTYLPAVAYSIGAGPFWKTLIKFGYDPCADSSSRVYQRVFFYVHVANRASNPNPLLYSPSPEGDDDDEEDAARTRSGWEKQQERLVAEGKREPLDRSRDYIFDGKILHRDMPDFQLCDITDPLTRRYIEDPSNVKNTCDPVNGWYTPNAFSLIKNMLKLKYMHVRNKNTPAPDSICYDAIESFERGRMQDEDEGNGDPSGKWG